MIEIKAYQCEYGCKKYLKTKKSMISHEDKCLWNPKHKACASCGNNEYYEDDDGYQSWKGMWCKKLEFELFDGYPSGKYNGKKNCKYWIKKD